MYGKKPLLLFLGMFLCGGTYAHADALPYFTAQSVSFTNIVEEAGYESDLLLYAMSDPTRVYTVFSYKKEPGAQKTITVQDWSYLMEGFGFAFTVHTGGLFDATGDYTLYGDPLLNRRANGTVVDQSIQHLSLTSQYGKRVLALDDQLAGPSRDADYDDMVVTFSGCAIDTISPAPVPEPSTMLLMSIGTAGLTACCRRRKKKIA